MTSQFAAMVARVPTEAGAIRTYSADIGGAHPRVGLFVVTHLLPDRPFFLEALASKFTFLGVLPKPRSVDTATLHVLYRAGYPIRTVSRGEIADGTLDAALSEGAASVDRVVL